MKYYDRLYHKLKSASTAEWNITAMFSCIFIPIFLFLDDEIDDTGIALTLIWFGGIVTFIIHLIILKRWFIKWYEYKNNIK